MAVESIGQIIQSIGRSFDGNIDGALKGVERYAFLRELVQRLDPPETRGLTADAGVTSAPPSFTVDRPFLQSGW